MSQIAQNIAEIKSKLPAGTRLIAVSKTKSNEDILEAYKAGQRDFGENKVQELIAKYEVLPKDIRWHMIGHLQSNKVKLIVPFVHLIHGVDSLKLLEEINEKAIKNNKVVNCLLQIYIASEETKFGFSQNELNEALDSKIVQNLKGVKICGLMGMASNTENKNQIRKEFEGLAYYFNELKLKYFSDSDEFKEISCGMSGDYEIAAEMGSTMVRIGSAVFGQRNYEI